MQAKTTHSTFEIKKDTQFECCHNLIAQTKPEENKEYNSEDAMSMARLINDLNIKINKEGASFAQQYVLNKGVKVFGHKGQDTFIKEMNQLLCRSCFTPLSVTKMTPTEWRKAQQALLFLAGREVRWNHQRKNDGL